MTGQDDVVHGAVMHALAGQLLVELQGQPGLRALCVAAPDGPAAEDIVARIEGIDVVGPSVGNDDLAV